MKNERQKKGDTMISFTCPTCGATMELDDPRDTLWCMYCGQKLLLDQRTKRVRIEKTVNINQRITNDAEIEKQKTKQERSSDFVNIVFIVFVVPLIAFLFYTMFKYTM